MASGSRRKRTSGDEYVFIDGKAMRADEAVRIELTDSDVFGQSRSVAVPGADEAAELTKASKDSTKRGKGKAPSKARQALDKMEQDGLELRDDALSLSRLMEDDRRKMRKKYLAFGVVLAAIIFLSLCISEGYYDKLYSPSDVIACWVQWFHLTFISLTSPGDYAQARYAVLSSLPMYTDVIAQVLSVFKYAVCGIMLALSGMLYQNTFRNPIAAPSMLGVSNGVSIALLVLVMQFGYSSLQLIGLYYVYAYLGGAFILVLVMLGGAYISGKGRFNVVNMLLVGTIISQLLGVIINYVQNYFMTDDMWNAYYYLQTATGLDSIWTYISMLIGCVVTIVPIYLFRFRLNLVSFPDAETKMLGVNPNRLRILALVCGSIMILTAQVNSGQVAMASLVVPFVVRAVFGSEFRKQLGGNILVGALILVVAGDVTSYFSFNAIFQLDVGSIVTVLALPLFVWMIAVRQRSWE